jgi:hypothetical protein
MERMGRYHRGEPESPPFDGPAWPASHKSFPFGGLY